MKPSRDTPPPPNINASAAAKRRRILRVESTSCVVCGLIALSCQIFNVLAPVVAVCGGWAAGALFHMLWAFGPSYIGRAKSRYGNVRGNN
jgi:hypothetical protein